MTDRELLELAAKAAGIFVTREQFERDCTSPWDPTWENLEYDDEGKSISGWETIYSYDGELSGWGVTSWSPLTSDGDALRLAVKLHIDIGFHGKDGMYAQSQAHLGEFQGSGGEFDCGIDDYALTRRSIVEAAAEIGSLKP